MITTDYKYIVRIVGNDIPGNKKIISGLTQIRGVGYTFANSILNSLKIDHGIDIGYLNDQQISSIEKIIKEPTGFPIWFLNRRKDIETGKNLHLIDSDITLKIRKDLEREKITNSWKGYRRMFNLKVRGQRTRCTGRRGGAVGVKKGGKIVPRQTTDQKNSSN